jgi:hypothetical protein
LDLQQLKVQEDRSEQRRGENLGTGEEDLRREKELGKMNSSNVKVN